MESFIIARALHVLAVILWIGGVAFVTWVILPNIRATRAPEERLAFFEQVEGRFASQARWWTLLAGASGFYLLYVLDGWGRYTQAQFWWVHAMTLVWVIFTLMLFVLEPLVLHRVIRALAQRDPEGTFRRIERLHWVLLALSLVAAGGAVLGSHGF
ncbi:hypothetical protein BURK2_01437 [Burkholderiales bacterium]|nr:MAG: hypothetical protein F9K47_08290 [Burkholderiales bacterium]CAG0973555.1 hypothetical protein BURK2_01437 [Burkholderiales bacterium]